MKCYYVNRTRNDENFYKLDSRRVCFQPILMNLNPRENNLFAENEFKYK